MASGAQKRKEKRRRDDAAKVGQQDLFAVGLKRPRIELEEQRPLQLESRSEAADPPTITEPGLDLKLRPNLQQFSFCLKTLRTVRLHLNWHSHHNLDQDLHRTQQLILDKVGMVSFSKCRFI